MDITVQISNTEIDLFHAIYERKCSYEGTIIKKMFIGNAENKICRFCLKDADQTSFRNRAHVLPEFIGNKFIFSHFECDSCNALFSRYEDSLANFGGILSTFSMVKGKRGVPKHKSKIDELEVFEENGQITIRSNPVQNSEISGGPKAVEINKEKEALRINTLKPSYIPQDVFKALCKIMFCMLDDTELKNYDLARRWLLGDYSAITSPSNDLFIAFQRVGGKIQPRPIAHLQKKREVNKSYPSPSHTMILCYGVFIYQIFLPFNQQDQWLYDCSEIFLPIEQDIVSAPFTKPDGSVATKMISIDLTSTEKKVDDKDNFTVGFTLG